MDLAWSLPIGETRGWALTPALGHLSPRSSSILSFGVLDKRTGQQHSLMWEHHPGANTPPRRTRCSSVQSLRMPSEGPQPGQEEKSTSP